MRAVVINVYCGSNRAHDDMEKYFNQIMQHGYGMLVVELYCQVIVRKLKSNEENIWG